MVDETQINIIFFEGEIHSSMAYKKLLQIQNSQQITVTTLLF